MSMSDSDEDELLQMALKEQAQRDLTYQKPPSSSSSRPVANLVQQPRQHKPSPARKPSMDEPEVELLSISSEDDDVERESDVRERGRAKKEDDGGGTLDGEEPDCWKRVNEAELARRVRDMRESRTAPVVQKLEDKVSEPGKKVVLTSLQSLPRVMECIDPLKLGIIDNKTLRLISESLGSPSKAEKVDNTLGEKLIYFSDHFDPKLFLSRIHQDTSAADLEAGALGLKSDLKGRNLQRKQLVKDNFDCFVSCKTTIDDIESKLKRIEEDPEGSGTTHVFNCMKSVTSRANLAFEPLFERQAQAEKIRSVQGMLQRFRTLFNLPSIIRNSISKGEYDLAVREYKKAKSIALPSHVNILKRVLEEVEKVMLEFKGTLYKTMEDTKIDFTSLENTVRLLLELEPESDPVWHYINVQNHRIHGLLEKCTYDHEARVETLRNETRERAISDAKWQQIQQNVVPYSDAASSTESNEVQVDLQSVEFPSEEIDALKGRYIKIITGVLVHHIPAFWKTALSVFSGKFAKSSQVTDTSANKSEEKVTEARFSTHSLEEVAGMIRKGEQHIL
ncbi:exocyst complex component SEC5A-like isoform X1 [Brassica napus]|uniref:exocyst complex component SEC5A-like isoform X1 n=1 Tax=Brassica napus TaxID=3708 RepID=UPI0020789C22|nr:exocyst complex component SEC5A-like isoform X1 [Brassica napus]XP_048617510.1 exocyst complex component SEC5A-like isoform X1 [Brassica napus]XP_048617511.1 exocyst complex component SEC5A-like isoform X1 [Brassica napus]XP_048617517.1 exocyst complex component SEC5A-like isoform X1 [Brassica napus]XP_048617522.1 exocyst complex component SEC5A-like isoform X1 [Brassica napus]XP_048617523.1 exocyst complex component SEC5A-like isoform X1 [Brassica napus]XP_048617524.1 exocyst complex comp